MLAHADIIISSTSQVDTAIDSSRDFERQEKHIKQQRSKQQLELNRRFDAACQVIRARAETMRRNTLELHDESKIQYGSQLENAPVLRSSSVWDEQISCLPGLPTFTDRTLRTSN
jgi:hypothetical protein